MLLNLKPYIDVKNNGKAQSYTLGISTDKSYIDQKRDVIDVMPGYQIVVKVIPQVVGASSLFAEMDQSSRNCKLSHEIADFNLIQHYTTTGCEFECAAKKAISQCKCLPWFYTSNFTNIPMCDTFSAYCFDHVMSDESNYKMCPEICRETCNDLPMTVAVTYLPIDEKEACGKGGLFHDHLMQATRQYYVFESYKALINGRIPDFKTGINNGSFCQDFVKRYVAQVSVASSTSSVTKSLRSPRVTFIDQLGIIGGNLGNSFSISSHQGAGKITIAQPLDYNKNKYFKLSIKAIDSGGRFSTSDVNVNITDSNNHAPRFENTPYIFDVFEDAPIGSTVSMLFASDKDHGENAKISYRAIPPSDTFLVERETGALVVNSPLDRESVSTVILTVMAEDGGLTRLSDQTEVQISILDVNDNAPQFDSSYYEGSVHENSPAGASVAEVNAHDADEGEDGKVRYRFYGRSEDEQSFTVDPVSGVIRTKRPLDRETRDYYEIMIEAYDSGKISLNITYFGIHYIDLMIKVYHQTLFICRYTRNVIHSEGTNSRSRFK